MTRSCAALCRVVRGGLHSKLGTSSFAGSPQAGRDRHGRRRFRGLGISAVLTLFGPSTRTLRYDQCQSLASTRAIDCEIRIQGADRQPGNFSEPHNTCIGERHRNIAVTAHQAAHRLCLSIEPKRNAQGSVTQAFQQPPGLNFLPGEQETGFGQYRFASQQWRGEVRELLNGPAVTSFTRAEIGHQWPGIDHRSRCHRPKSSMYFGFVA